MGKTCGKNVHHRSTKDEKQLADAIQAYLQECPSAADALEGIAEWWILRQCIRVEVQRLEKVLTSLTEKGVLEKFGDKQNPCYRLKRKSVFE